MDGFQSSWQRVKAIVRFKIITQKENFSKTQLRWLKLLRSKNIIKSRDRQSRKVCTTDMTGLPFLPQKELILGAPTRLGPALCFTLEAPHPANPKGLLNPLYKWPVTQRVQWPSPQPSEPEWGGCGTLTDVTGKPTGPRALIQQVCQDGPREQGQRANEQMKKCSASVCKTCLWKPQGEATAHLGDWQDKFQKSQSLSWPPHVLWNGQFSSLWGGRLKLCEQVDSLYLDS